MDQTYVCTQCGEESDAQGQCPMCGLPMVPARDENDDSDYDSSFDDEEGGSDDAAVKDDEDEEEASYNPYEE